MTQILQSVAVAQNAALAMSLRRIEQQRDKIEGRLEGIEARLAALGTGTGLILGPLRRQPVGFLKTAKTVAVLALREGDRNALIAAGEDAQQAYHDLLSLAQDLVQNRPEGIAVAVQAPDALADLSEGAAEAAMSPQRSETHSAMVMSRQGSCGTAPWSCRPSAPRWAGPSPTQSSCCVA